MTVCIMLWIILTVANKKKDKNLVRVTVSLDPDDYKAFEQLAVKEERSAAWFIRRSMREFLDRKHGSRKVVQC